MSNNATEKVKFVQFYQPPLESGEYKVSIQQNIEGPDKSSEPSSSTFSGNYSRELTFAVLGERFGPLSPDDIYAVFPPSDSLGQHSNVLPHITVKRTTLPWERYPGTSDENLSWLVLLLFRDSDFTDFKDTPKVKSIQLKELEVGEVGIAFPKVSLEVGQTPEQEVDIIDVKKKYVKDILPSKEDLEYVAHARQAKDKTNDYLADETNGYLGDEYSTIICGRLPEENGISTVHLVSVEGRYLDTGFDFADAPNDDDLIRFVSLASWSFACVDPEQSFTQILQKLNRTPGVIRLPNIAEDLDGTAERFLSMGYVPLPHAMRQGSQTISWYRSPCVPGTSLETYPLPVAAADELLRYDSELSLFDTSYAAAWQLGRMLTLANQVVALELFNWKRKHAQNLQRLQEYEDYRLPSRSPQAEPPPEIEVPESVEKWFRALGLLKGLAFNYLVPDNRLLPQESIRFFWLDPHWVNCLQDGAFSIGRVTPVDQKRDRETRVNGIFSRSDYQQPITGILIRSQVVSGWPGLLVTGYDRVWEGEDSIDDTEALILPLLRMERLAKDVLICLFEGEVKTIDVHQRPEAMHFGLDAPTMASPDWSKNLRKADGNPTYPSIVIPAPLATPEKEVVNLTALANSMKTELDNISENSGNFLAEKFALQMIEGVQKVRFTQGSSEALRIHVI